LTKCWHFLPCNSWMAKTNMNTEDKCHQLTSSNNNTHCYSLENWNQHMYLPKIYRSKGFNLKHLKHCFLLVIQNMHVISTTFNQLSLPIWLIFYHLCLWMNPAKQQDNSSNGNAYNLVTQTCLANLSLHSFSIIPPNMLVQVT
jgi:hypothetical protein